MESLKRQDAVARVARGGCGLRMQLRVAPLSLSSFLPFQTTFTPTSFSPPPPLLPRIIVRFPLTTLSRASLSSPRRLSPAVACRFDPPELCNSPLLG